jgi:hypothetical protein
MFYGQSGEAGGWNYAFSVPGQPGGNKFQWLTLTKLVVEGTKYHLVHACTSLIH